eukprot:2099679-Amphidinium_carterae.1
MSDTKMRLLSLLWWGYRAWAWLYQASSKRLILNAIRAGRAVRARDGSEGWYHRRGFAASSSSSNILSLSA